MYLVSHRGLDNHIYSENSLKAIESVLNKDYIDGIEIDVRITKDKKIVLIHDPVIDLISNGYGIVKYMNFDDLNKYQYGKSKESIITLDNLLDIINTDKIILIEIKEFGNDFINLVEETIKIISKHNLNIYISSFNYRLLNYVKSKYKSVKCGLIIGYGLNLIHFKNNLDFNIVSYHYYKQVDSSKLTFIFNLDKNNYELNHNAYLVTDTSFKFNKI